MLKEILPKGIMLKGPRDMPRAAAGFSLIELMVALVVGLIVVGSALALTMTIIEANGKNVQSTRLSQELRAVGEIVAREVRRSRSIADPIAHIGRPDLGEGSYNVFDATTTAGCVIYSYEGPTEPLRVIRRAVVSTPTRGTVQLARGTVGGTAVDCNTTGAILTSPQVDITALTFTQGAGSDLFNIDVTGNLVADPSISRTVSTAVHVRSSKLPPAP